MGRAVGNFSLLEAQARFRGLEPRGGGGLSFLAQICVKIRDHAHVAMRFPLACGVIGGRAPRIG